MSIRTLAALAALLAAPALTGPALADDGIHIENAYARISPGGSGAVFFEIVNHSDRPDRLLAAASDDAARAELHAHVEDSQGVMRMIEVEDGIPVPGGGTRALARGGDHVMLMGLARPLRDGDSLTLTLTFERGQVITLAVPIDNARAPAGHGGHSGDHTGGHTGHAAPTN